MHITEGRRPNFTLTVYIFRRIWVKKLGTEDLPEMLLDDGKFRENRSSKMHTFLEDVKDILCYLLNFPSDLDKIRQDISTKIY